MKKIKFNEGLWFTLPLRRGHVAVGLVARKDRRGDSFLGYYFAPPPSGVPFEDYIRQLRPQDALLVGATGTYGFNHGTWKPISTSQDWTRDDWPIPVFTTRAGVAAPRLETYGDEDVLIPIPSPVRAVEPRIPQSAISTTLMASGAVEDRLWDKLRPEAENSPVR